MTTRSSARSSHSARWLIDEQLYVEWREPHAECLNSSQVDRVYLHALLDRIAPRDLGAIERVLRAFAEDDDPVSTALRKAPADSEALSDHEQAGLAEYEALMLRGATLERTQPDDLLRKFGFDDSGR